MSLLVHALGQAGLPVRVPGRIHGKPRTWSISTPGSTSFSRITTCRNLAGKRALETVCVTAGLDIPLIIVSGALGESPRRVAVVETRRGGLRCSRAGLSRLGPAVSEAISQARLPQGTPHRGHRAARERGAFPPGSREKHPRGLLADQHFQERNALRQPGL